MANLTGNQQSFIQLMKKSPEHARRGFELLCKRDDLDRFFEALSAEGLFAPTENPAPVPVEPAGSVQIPYWSALEYLLACAKRAGEREDTPLAEKVIAVVRLATLYRDHDGKPRDNFHTFRRFAEILGLLPLGVITDADIDLVSTWLESRFDRDGVAHALDGGAIARLLQNDSPDRWSKAARLVGHCLAIRWQKDSRRGRERDEPVPVVDPYWLKELVNHHAGELGRKVGHEAAKIFAATVREMFDKGERAAWSYLFRPAVEDHGQNHSWKTAENAAVEGLRDVMLGWSAADANSAKAFTRELLTSDVQMLRRVGLYVLNKQWAAFRDLYPPLVTPSLFSNGQIHELYALLRDHFDELAVEHKTATVEAIRGIQEPEGEDAQLHLKRTQRRWLSAIANTRFEPAAKWIAELAADPEVGLSEHPDFNSFIESSWGHGPSPYQLNELVAFAEQGTIVEVLNGFKATNTWRGPSVEALVGTLEEAVSAGPQHFSRALPKFAQATLPYQQGGLTGFKRLWELPHEKQTFQDWDQTWVRLIALCEELLKTPSGEGESPDHGRRRSWLLSVMADLLQSGTRDDDHAYPRMLLSRGWSLLENLADQAEAVDSAGDDPMTDAINTPKGRTIEAIFSHALRECRLSDKESGTHASVWDRLRARLDDELAKCARGNFEFSTLAAAHLGNLDYLDSGWLAAKISLIFPADRAGNFLCAVGGLAYASTTRRLYVLLRDAGVLDRALSMELRGRDVPKNLIERIILGYLWDEETLESPRIKELLARGRTEDLEATGWFLWTIRGEKLSSGQIKRIIDFWEASVAWARAQSEPPAKLLCSLGNLAWTLPNADGRNRDLLLAVAPYVAVYHSTHEFLGQLHRLVEASPQGVSAVLGKLIETSERYYDYENRLKSLIARLADLGERPAALTYCDRLRDMPGVAELFSKLTAKAPS